MRRLAVALILIAVPLAQGQLSVDQGVDVVIDHELLGPDGEPTDELTPGSGATLNISLTNQDNSTVNGTFFLEEPGNGSRTNARDTGPVEPNATGVALLPLFVDDTAEAGTKNLTLNGIIMVKSGENWTHAQNETRNLTIRVVTPTREPTFPVVPVAMGVAAAGLGGAALYLRSRQTKQRLPPEATEEEKRQARQERQQSIVDAKRQDIRDSIERARERMEDGEITEYQFERIKERKEADLDELDDDDLI